MYDETGIAPEGFVFRGSAREWFGIWIVNLVLTILTVGIYSAWAKVRTKKYFAQNTYVAGRNFDYHATGLQILIGRIIVIAAIIAYSILSQIGLVALIMLLGLLVAVPWLMVRALRFNATMHSYSNVRFGFDGSMGGAFLSYMLYPFLTALTLYTTYPFLDRAVKRYTMNNHRLGNNRFEFDAPIGPFYKGFLTAIIWVAAVTMIIAAVVLSQIGTVDLTTIENDPTASLAIGAAFYVWIFVAFVPASTIYGAFVRNVTLSNLELEGGHRFVSNVRPLKLVWIAISNALITIVSLGLMLPWAQVRITRYLADHTTLIPGASLDNFVSQMERQQNALGDAYGDIEGIELGLPV
ncbi:MAG: YjgN family protein [Pseudomonadota bacterium]